MKWSKDLYNYHTGILNQIATYCNNKGIPLYKFLEENSEVTECAKSILEYKSGKHIDQLYLKRLYEKLNSCFKKGTR